MHIRFHAAVIILYIASTGLLAQDKSFLSNSQVGFKLGYNYASMNYFNKIHDSYTSSSFKRSLWGLAGQYSFSSSLSINPELLYIEKGQTIRDEFNFTLRANYIDMNIAFLLHLYPTSRIANPYVSLGPTIGLLLGGDIAYNDYKIDISKANMAPYNLGIRMAVGLQKMIKIKSKKVGTLVVEGAYQLGQTDTYSAMEKTGEAIALNAIDYEISSARKHRGWEVALGLLIPIDLFRKNGDVQPVMSERDSESKIVEKDCYSIEEIIADYKRGTDIRNRKICLFNINFEFDKSDLLDESKVYLNEIVELLTSMKNLKLKINGHTDNKGGRDYNLQLSKRRAKSVYLFFTEEAGIDKDRLSFEGFGETKPIDTNATEEGRARNRRVEFEIVEQ